MIARVVASICRELLGEFYAELDRDSRAVASARLDYFTERLEPRLLLAEAIATNLPVWSPQGPGTIREGGVAGIADRPNTGAVHVIAFRPNDPDTAYVGTVGGGIWKTENARAPLPVQPSWLPKTDFFPTGSITSLVFDLSDTARNTLYAGTGKASSSSLGGFGAGILTTVDGGTNWKLIEGPFQSKTVHDIIPTQIVEPGKGRVYLVASDLGIFRSTTGAPSIPANDPDREALATQWIGGLQQVTAGLPGGPFGDGTIKVTSLIADPVDPFRYYAGIPEHGVFMTTNAGASWTPTALTNLPAATRIELTISRTLDSNSNQPPVYAAVAVDVQGTLASPASKTDRSIAVTDASLFETPDKIFVGEDSLEIAWIEPGSGSDPDTIHLVKPLKFDHAAGAKVRSSETRLSGIFRSANRGGTWLSMTLPSTTDIHWVDADGDKDIDNNPDELKPQQHGLHPGGQADLHFSFLADPDNADIVYVGGDTQPEAIGTDLNNSGTVGDAPNEIFSAAGLTDYVGRLFRGNFSLPVGSRWEQIVGNAADPDGPGGPAKPTAPHADSRFLALSDGKLWQADDGGVYMLDDPANVPGGAPRQWHSRIGNLTLTEFYSVAWRPDTNTVFGGAQDVGTVEQSGPGSVVWDEINGGDGGFVHAVRDPNAGPNGPVLLYFSSQELGSFTFANQNPVVTVKGSGGTTPTLKDFDPALHFIQPYAVNAIDPRRILIGTGGDGFLYEGVLDATGSSIELALIGGSAVLKNGEQRPGITAAVGSVNAMVYGGREPGSGGGGGGGGGASIPQPNVAFVGTIANVEGHSLFMRGRTGSKFAAVTSFVKASGAPAVAVAVDPLDWRHVYVADSAGKIWFSSHGDAAPDANPLAWDWTDVSNNLTDLSRYAAIHSLTVHHRPGEPVVLLVGGDSAVYRSINHGRFAELGMLPPRAIVSDIEYNAEDNVLIAGTVGRGAWAIFGAAELLRQPTTMTVLGTDSGESIHFERNARQPWMLDVFSYAPGVAKPAGLAPVTSLPFAAFERIDVEAGDGDDFIIFDGSTGALSSEVFVNGGAGTNHLRIQASRGVEWTDNVANRPGTNGGSHSFRVEDIWGHSLAQETEWENIQDPQGGSGFTASVDQFGTGLRGTADGARGVTATATRDVRLPFADGSALAALLGGLAAPRPRPKDDPFVDVSQVNPDGPAQIDNGSSFIQRLIEEGRGAFRLSEIGAGGRIATLDELRVALDGLDTTAGNVTFSDAADVTGDGVADSVFHVRVDKNLSSIIALNVGAELGGLGEVGLGGSMRLSADFHLDLRFGIDAGGFFILPSAAGAAPALRLDNLAVEEINGRGRFGLLGVSVADASLALDPGISIDLRFADSGGAPNVIRLDELSPSRFADALEVDLVGDPGDGQDDLTFTGTFGLALVAANADLSGVNIAEAAISLGWEDLGDAGVIELPPQASALLDFLEIAGDDILPHLTQVASQLAAAQSRLDFDVPFLSGDSDFTHLVDVAGAFADKILDPLRNDDGSPAFQTLQDVVGLLAGSLDIDLGDEPIVSYDSATGALAFHVPMTVVFDPVTRQLVLASNTAEGASFGNVSADLEAALMFDFTFGYNVKSADPIETFFFQINELSASLSGAINAPTLSGNVGTFRTTVANASVEFGVDVAVVIDDTGAPGLSLGELAAFNDADVTANTRLMFAASGVGGSIGGTGLGVSMTGAQIAFGLFGAFDNTRATQPPTQFALDVSVPNGGIALVGAGDALSLSGGGTVRWNSDTANAVFEEEIGNSGLGLDLPAAHKLATVQGRLSIPNLVDFDGSVAFDLAASPSLAARDLNGNTVNVSVFKFGASNISGFAGAYENGLPAAGLLLEDVDVALALMRPTSASDPRRFFALETTIGNIDVIGFGDANDPNNPVRLDVSNVAVNVNGALNANSPNTDVAALNLSLTPIAVPTGPGSSITLDYAAQLLQVSATLSLSTDSFDVTTTVTGGVVNDEPQWLIELLDVTLDNGVHVRAEDVELHFDPPTSPNQSVLTVASASADFPVLGEPLNFAVTGLNLRRSGAFEFTSASLTGNNLLALSDFLPLSLSNVFVSGLNGQPARFDAFTLTADGVFADTLFQNDLADPVIELGQVSIEAGNTFGFGIEVDGDNVRLLGRETPADPMALLAGPLRLGFVEMTLGPLEFDATVTLGQFTAGVYAATALGFDGKIRGAGQSGVLFENPNGGESVSEIGFGGVARVTHPNNGTLLDIDATLSVSFDTGQGGFAQLAVDDLEAAFDLKLDFDQNFQHRDSRVALESVSAGQVDVRFGEEGDEILLLRSTTAEIHFDDESGEPFMSFGSITASLPKLQQFLIDGDGDPIEGTVFDFAIGHDFSFQPGDEFGILFDNIPRAEAFGLPEWLPFRIQSIGFRFADGAIESGEIDPLDLILTVSAGVNTDLTKSPIRFTAEVSDLSVNLGTFADIVDGGGAPTPQELLNAVTFGGFLIGIEGVKIGEALEIGGKFGLRMIQDNDGDNALVATIGGFFGMAGIGGGIELTIAEVGPVMAKLDVPLGIPLGPSGIILSGVSGGFRFGGPNFGAPDDPLDLLTAGTTPDPNNPGSTQLASIFDPLHFDPDELDNEIRRLLALDVPTWTQSFTVALEGEATTIASPGILDGALTLAAQIRPGPTPEISFVGAGEITLFGLPVGAVGAILDFTEPLSPTFDLAYAAPIPGSPIAFLFPAQSTFTVQVDTQGLIELPLVGLQAFLNGAAGSALDNLLAEIAEAISLDRQRPLARALIDDLPANSPVTGPALKSLLLGKLPIGAQGLAALSQTQINDLADLSSAILAELFDVGRQLTTGQWDEVFDDLKTFIEIGASAAIETFDNATGAARQALMSFWDRFNPRMVATGKVQPTILGFPFGEATQGSFRIDKDGFSLGFTGSIIETMQTVADLYFLPIFGTSGIPGRFIEFMTLGIEDHTTFTVGLDGVDNLFQSIAFGGEFPNLNPELDFSASFSSTLSFLGFNLVQVSGAVFSPGSSILAFGDEDDVSNGTFLRVYNLPLDEQNPGNLSIPDAFNNLIPIERFEDEIAFNTYGGFLLTGQLLAPEMLTDPVGLIADMIADGDFVPTANLIAYLTNLVDQLTRDEELGRLQLYLPSMASIFDVTIDALGRQHTNPILSAANQAEDLIDEIFFRGFLTSKVLSFNYGRASFEVTSDGIVVHGEIPWLLGLDATLTLDMATVNMNQVVEALAGAAGHNVNLRNITQVNVPVPVGAIVLTLDAERMATLIAQQFHLPENVFVPGDVSAQARLALYSPGFGLINGADPDDISAAQRTGGIELSALLDVGDFIDDARFLLEAPLYIDDASHFHAEAHIEHLRIPGIGRVAQDILNADLHAVLDFGGGDFEFALDGNLRFLNLIDAGIDAFLHINDSGIWGSFELFNSEGTGGLVIDAGLFKLTGSLVMRVNTTGQTRDGIPASPQFMLRADAALSIFGGIEIPDDRVYNGLLITGNLDLVFTKDSFTINSGIDLVTDFPFPIPNFGEDTDGDGIRDKGIGASASLTVVTNSNANGARSPAIDGSLTIGDATFTLDRFGVINDLIPIPFIGNADQHVIVDDQRFNETNGRKSHDIVLRLSKPAEHRMVINYRLRPGSAARLDDYDADDASPGGNDITGSVTIEEGQSSATSGIL